MDPITGWLPYLGVARASLTTLRFGNDIAVDWISRHLEEMRCSPNYPETVAHTVMLARELCMVGCIFYELFTTSAQYSASACEAGLKQKFVEVLPIPCVIKRTHQGAK